MSVTKDEINVLSSFTSEQARKSYGWKKKITWYKENAIIQKKGGQSISKRITYKIIDSINDPLKQHFFLRWKHLVQKTQFCSFLVK